MRYGSTEILRVFPIPSQHETQEISGDLTCDADHVWYSSVGSRKIYQMDSQTGALVGTIATQWDGVGLTYDTTGLWQADAKNPLLYAINIEKRALARRLPLTQEFNVSSMAFDGEHLWIADMQQCVLTAIDPTSGQVRRVLEVDAHVSGLTFQVGKLLFCHPFAEMAEDSLVGVIDLRSGQIEAQFRVAGTPAKLAWGQGSLWYLDGRLQQICQLRLIAPQTHKTIPTTGAASGLVSR